MNTPDNDKHDATRWERAGDLRARAEARVRERRGELPEVEELSPDEVHSLLHELRVHEVELEMQNETLRETRQALQASLTRYHDLYEFAPVGYVTLDGEGVIRQGNLTAVSLLGQARTTFTGKRLSDFVSREGQDALYFFLRKLAQTGGPADTELWLERSDGSRLYARLDGDAVQGTSPLTEERYRVTLSDLTELQWAQEQQQAFAVALEEEQVRTEELYQATEEANRLLSTILETMPAGAVLCDAGGSVLTTNRVGQEILEGRVTGTVQKPGTAYTLHRPDGSPMPREEVPLMRALDEGAVVRDEELLLAWPDGHERWLLASAAPVQDEQGHCVSAITVFQEITERKRAEEEREWLLEEVDRERRRAERFAQELQQERDVLRTILDNMPTGVIISDSGGRLLATNRRGQEILGEQPEGSTFAPQRAYSLHRPDGSLLDPAEETPLSRAVTDGEVVRDMEMLLRRADGEERFLLASATPVRHTEGEILRGVIVFHDITRRRRAEAAMEALLQQVEEERARLKGLTRTLDRERQKLQVIMANTPAHLAYMDRDFNFLAVNEAYAAGTDLSERALVGRNHFALFPHDGNRALFERVRETGEALHFQARPFAYPRQSGGRLSYWDWSLIPVEGWEGEVEGLVLSLVDVTAQVRATQERERLLEENRRQREFLERMLEAAPVGVAVLEGPEYYYVYVNPTYQTFGEGAMVGRSLFEVFPEVRGTEVERLLESVCERGETVHLDRLPVELKGGRTYWEGAYVPLKGEGGQVERVLVVASEVTAQVEAAQERERLLEENRRQREFLEYLMGSVPVGVALVEGPGHRYVYANPAYQELAGLEEASLVGRTIADIFPALAGDDLIALLDDLYATGEGVSLYEHEVQLEPGDRSYWNVSYLPLRGGGGAVERVLIVASDVTEQVEAAREHARLQAFLEQLLQAAPIGVAIVTGPDYTFEFANARYAEITGLPLATLPGKRMAEALPGLMEGEGQSLLDGVRERGEPLSLQEFATVLRPGEPRTYWNVNLVPQRAIDGQGARVLILTSEVTEQVQIRQRIEALAARHTAVFGNMVEGLIIVSPDGAIIDMNPAALRLLGYATFDEVQRFLRAYPGDFRVETLEGEVLPLEAWPVSHVLAGEVFSGWELRIVRASHDVNFIASYNGSLVRDAQGEVVFGLLTFHDVTARKEAEFRLVELMREVEEERARLQAIIESAPEGIVVADEEARILFVNSAAEALYRRPVPLGEEYGVHAPAMQLYRSDGLLYDSRNLPLSRAALDGERVVEEELAILWPDGQRRSLLANAAPVRSVGGEKLGAVAVFQDITVRKRTSQLLRRRNRDLHLLNRMSRELGATLDLERVLERALDSVLATVPAEAAALWLADGDGRNVCRAAVGYPAGQSPVGYALERGQSVVGRVQEQGESIIARDVAGDARFVPLIDDRTGFETRSLLGVPLLSHERSLGVIAVINRRGGSFTSHDRSLVETLANAAAAAIENARLHEASREAAMEEERGRLARDLHDAVSQTLFSASMTAEALPRIWEHDPERVRQGLEHLAELTRGALAEMRALLLELRPRALTETDLPHLLAQLVRAVDSRTHVEVNLEAEGERKLPPEIQIALYRIAQEALNNVVKHAEASRATVRLLSCESGVELHVVDNGKGLDLQQSLATNHLGLRIMQERAEANAIDLEFLNRPGGGTEVVARWSVPVKESEAS